MIVKGQFDCKRLLFDPTLSLSCYFQFNIIACNTGNWCLYLHLKQKTNSQLTHFFSELITKELPRFAVFMSNVICTRWKTAYVR